MRSQSIREVHSVFQEYSVIEGSRFPLVSKFPVVKRMI